jgi:hypothetical protein
MSHSVSCPRAAQMLLSATVAASLTAIIFLVANRNDKGLEPVESALQSPDSGELIVSLLEIPKVSHDSDIGFLNLATAPGISSEQRNRIISDGLRTLDTWAASVAEQTWKNRHRYLENQREFKNEIEWKLGMMCTVLGQDFKVRYDPSLTSADQQNASNERFFSNPASVFLTGCLSESRIGTCASLPVLYVAVGRRVGYPMHLVAAKGHLFARWDDGKGARVNLEAANAGGFTSHPDAHYRSWPSSITPLEEKSGNYLRNLTAEESLAIFMSTRAYCLRSAGKNADAISAAAAAFRLAPNLGGISQALQATVSGNSQRELHEELQYQQAMLRMRQTYDPMDPTPHIPMPGMSGQFQPAFPQPAFGQPHAMPNTALPPAYNPHAPR